MESKSLADRAEAIGKQMEAIGVKTMGVMFRLFGEVQAIPEGEFRDNVFELLRKVFPDHDIVDNKKTQPKVNPDEEVEDEREGAPIGIPPRAVKANLADD